MSADPSPPPKRRRPGWMAIGVVVAALVVGVPLITDAAQQANWDANSGTHSVEVGGARLGDGFEVADSATLETWDEHKETAVSVFVSRGQDSPSRTPRIALDVDGIRCESSRNYIWSTDAGSTLTLLCEGYLPLDQMNRVEVVTVQGVD